MAFNVSVGNVISYLLSFSYQVKNKSFYFKTFNRFSSFTCFIDVFHSDCNCLLLTFYMTLSLGFCHDSYNLCLINIDFWFLLTSLEWLKKMVTLMYFKFVNKILYQNTSKKIMKMTALSVGTKEYLRPISLQHFVFFNWRIYEQK